MSPKTQYCQYRLLGPPVINSHLHISTLLANNWCLLKVLGKSVLLSRLRWSPVSFVHSINMFSKLVL